MWALLALTTAICYSVIVVIDKRLLDHHLPSVSCLYLWIALVLLLYIGIVVGFTGLPLDGPPDRLLVAFGSGLAIGVALALLFAGLKIEEASRAIAITQIFPVFVAALAVLFLGETLNRLQWVSIALVVAGTMLISLPGVPAQPSLRPSWGIPALLGSAVFLALTFFASKYALGGLSVWTVFVLQQLGNVLVFSIFSRPKIWRELYSVVKRRNTLLLLLIAEGVLPIVAIMLGLQATSLGPVSLVTAFLATTPLFVFIISTVLSHSRWRLMDESLTYKSLAVKFTSIAMIVVGVSALGLF